MKKVELWAVGKPKFRELQPLEDLYRQRINYFVQFSIKNLQEFHGDNEKRIQTQEGEMILKALKERDTLVALDRGGRRFDSPGFARFLERTLASAGGRLVFLIGGFCGLGPILDSRIQAKVSFSDLTFGHDVFRVLFLEQLYRGFTLIHGMTYHR